ncbi:MAG: tRNA (guanosine(37)-N1)-methyltransferase TrmD [Rhodospirillales bacterium]|nr:tRNA (guanosine(37)-N1)-methyltransferase TrmD [Rhodospirillales bacterium]
MAGKGGTGGAKAPWRALVLTLYPGMFPGPLGASIPGRAVEDGAWSLETVDIRDFASDRHRTVDDLPFGGGPGMVMKPDVVDAALAVAIAKAPEGSVAICLSPRGKPFTQDRARELAAAPGVVLLCGRFEGIDARVVEARELEEISIGDFVLSGGEPAAMCLIDACVRLLPGVLGAAESLGEESFEDGLLEYPHYTRPAIWQDREVPAVLTSGNHAKIRAWRRAEAERLTAERRPDLWAKRQARTKH